MIVLYTDFGADDPYVGQLKAALLHDAPGMAVIDLLHRAPDYDAEGAAHLLAALQAAFGPGSVFLAVVDPGVGGERAPAALHADGKWYVGPDNGLLSVVAARAREARSYRIIWRPARLSASFHGRDLFAPVAARIAAGTLPERWLAAAELQARLPGDDLARVIYVDHYGNCFTGLRTGGVARETRLRAGGRDIAHAQVFARVREGEPFWYENSAGLVEIAANRASAAALLGLKPGDPVALSP